MTSFLPLLFFAQVFLAQSKVIYYKFQPNNDVSINSCISDSIRQLEQETCLQFSNQSAPRTETVISFLESGHCLWQSNNNTAHLSKNCISNDTCQQIISSALTNQQAIHGVARHLNIKFNCTDKCTILCQNGGQVTSDCRCKCGYGFSGDQCENLVQQSYFTDSNCGIKTEEEGTITLSTYPKSMVPNTMCNWLIKPSKPWQTIEFTFVELDLNSRNSPPGKNCTDEFLVLGVKELENAIPCNHEFEKLRGRRFRSDGDWALFTLDSSRMSKGFKGPLIQYKTISNSGKEIRSFSDSLFNSSPSSFGTALLLTPLIALALPF